MRANLPPNLQVLIVYNPAAGQSPDLKNILDRVANLWRDRGWQVQIAATTAPGDATSKAQIAARSGYNAVVAAGGDGTVNEVMNGLVGTETALGVLPLGTVNIWAREMGLSMDLMRLSRRLSARKRRNYSARSRMLSKRSKLRGIFAASGSSFALMASGCAAKS
jgi:diacylglycerol kinase (ATP)